MAQVLTGLRDLIVTREIVYGTSNQVSTGELASDESHWKDAFFGTTLIDGATEDGNYFVGNVLIPITGTAGNIGHPRKITAWTPATDEFTLDSALPGIPQVGDTAIIGKFLRAKIDSYKPNQEKLPRDYQVRSFEKPSPILGKSSADLSFSTEWISTQYWSSTGNTIHELLMASIGTPNKEASATNVSVVVVGGDTSNLRITSLDGTKFAEYSAVAVEKDAGGFSVHCITAILEVAGAPGYCKLTLFPPLPAYPTAGKAVEACNTFPPLDGTGRIGVTVLILANSQQWRLTGCRGSVQPKEFTPGNYAELSFALKADTYANTESAWTGAVLQNSLEPPANYGGMVYQDGTLLSTPKASFDPGLKVVEKVIFDGVNGRNGFDIIGREPKAQVSLYNQASAELDYYDQNTEMKVWAQMGAPENAAGAVGFCLPSGRVSDFGISDLDGQEMFDLTIQPHDNETDYSSVPRPFLWYYKT